MTALSGDIRDLEKQKFLDSGNGVPAVRVLDVGSSIEWDTVNTTYPNDHTEVYTYKKGGVTVQTVTVVYTDATKLVLVSVTKT